MGIDTAQPTAQSGVTTSGARIVPVPIDSAAAFLARYDQATPAPIALAFGAFEEDLTLIGAAVVGDQRGSGARLALVIDPARRKLKIGSDLLHVVVTEASGRGIQRLRVSYPEGATGADALIRSSALLAARRRVGGDVTTVLLLPRAHGAHLADDRSPEHP